MSLVKQLVVIGHNKHIIAHMLKKCNTYVSSLHYCICYDDGMKLNRDDIVRIVRSLGLPPGSYVVFGSGPLARAEIRKTSDIDLLVTTRLFERLENEGWTKVIKDSGGGALRRDNVEIFKDWKIRGYDPHFEDLKAAAEYYKDVPFVNLHEVRKWKSHMNRPKDRHDVEMIDNYLAKNH